MALWMNEMPAIKTDVASIARTSTFITQEMSVHIKIHEMKDSIVVKLII